MGIQGMKNLIAVVLLLGCGAAHAATVLYDESVDGDAGQLSEKENLFLVSGENIIRGEQDWTNPDPDYDQFVLNIADGYQISSITPTATGIQLNGWFTWFVYVGNSQGQDGNEVFDAILRTNSEIFYYKIPEYPLVESQYFLGGFGAAANGGTSPEIAYEWSIIVTQVVPIPASVWLFGSALGGLGWMRRKQVA
jgi:hypothetical protein